MSKLRKTMLLIPDVHAQPGNNFDRFKALMTWLYHANPRIDKIVQIGDLWDFGSLCTHDQHLPDWHKRSLEADIEAGLTAFDFIMSIREVNDVAAKDVHILEGNHEDRYNKWMKSDNRLLTSGFPKTVRELIKTRRPSWSDISFHSFLKPTTIWGAVFSHYFVSGVMGRPQGGEHHANNLLRSQHTSCVCGHSHLLSTSTRTKADESKIHALVGGCFVDPNGDFGYASAARKLWWNGVHLLHFYASGEFDVESISLGRMT